MLKSDDRISEPIPDDGISLSEARGAVLRALVPNLDALDEKVGRANQENLDSRKERNRRTRKRSPKKDERVFEADQALLVAGDEREAEHLKADIIFRNALIVGEITGLILNDRGDRMRLSAADWIVDAGSFSRRTADGTIVSIELPNAGFAAAGDYVYPGGVERSGPNTCLSGSSRPNAHRRVFFLRRDFDAWIMKHASTGSQAAAIESRYHPPQEEVLLQDDARISGLASECIGPPIRPQNVSDMSLFAAVYWIARRGRAEDFDVGDGSAWRSAIDALLDKVRAGDLEVSGQRSERDFAEIVPGLLFRGVRFDHPYQNEREMIANTFHDVPTIEFHDLVSLTTPGEHGSDKLFSGNRQLAWFDLRVRGHDVAVLWPFQEILTPLHETRRIGDLIATPAEHSGRDRKTAYLEKLPVLQRDLTRLRVNNEGIEGGEATISWRQAKALIEERWLLKRFGIAGIPSDKIAIHDISHTLVKCGEDDDWPILLPAQEADDAPDLELRAGIEAARAHHEDGLPAPPAILPVYPESELHRDIEASYMRSQIPASPRKRRKHDLIAAALKAHGLHSDGQGKTATEIAHLIKDHRNVRTAVEFDALRKGVERYYQRVDQGASARKIVPLKRKKS